MINHDSALGKEIMLEHLSGGVKHIWMITLRQQIFPLIYDIKLHV